MSERDTGDETAVVQHHNDVLLVGRLGAAPEPRTLPSGDEIVTFRVVVDRPGRGKGSANASGRREPTVDTLDCAAWAARAQRSVASWRAGDVVEVSGAVRRRFFRSGAGAVSRTEVEMARGRVIRRAGSG